MNFFFEAEFEIEGSIEAYDYPEPRRRQTQDPADDSSDCEYDESMGEGDKLVQDRHLKLADNAVPEKANSISKITE